MIRRQAVAALDWTAEFGQMIALQVVGFGLLTRLFGQAASGRIGQLLWTAGTPGHAAVLLAGGLLARTATGTLGVLVDPEPGQWPTAWWHRLRAVVHETGTVALLAAAVVLFGGGWLS